MEDDYFLEASPETTSSTDIAPVGSKVHSVIGALIAVNLAANFLIIWLPIQAHEPATFGEHVVFGLRFGVPFATSSLSATWIVWGSIRFSRRMLTSGIIQGFVMICFWFGRTREGGIHFTDVAFTVGLLVNLLVTLLPLWILRIAGQRLLQFGSPDKTKFVKHKRQFEIKTLLAWTTLVAVVLAVFIVNKTTEDSGIEILEFTLLMTTLVAINSFLATAIIQAVLVQHWVRIWLLISIFVTFVVTFIENGAMDHIGSGGHATYLALLSINLVHVFCILASLSAARTCGYRLAWSPAVQSGEFLTQSTAEKLD